jgi:hypothetical protein
MSTIHTIRIAVVTEADVRTLWACSCGAGRNASDLANAGAEAHMHLRDVKEGLVS